MELTIVSFEFGLRELQQQTGSLAHSKDSNIVQNQKESKLHVNCGNPVFPKLVL